MKNSDGRQIQEKGFHAKYKYADILILKSMGKNLLDKNLSPQTSEYYTQFSIVQYFFHIY